MLILSYNDPTDVVLCCVMPLCDVAIYLCTHVIARQAKNWAEHMTYWFEKENIDKIFVRYEDQRNDKSLDCMVAVTEWLDVNTTSLSLSFSFSLSLYIYIFIYYIY